MKVTLENGMVIEGTVEEFRKIGVKFPVEEEVAESRRLTVGDYARVVANDTGHRAKVGDIVKIVEDEHDHHPYRCEKLNGEDVLWFKEHELAPVTEEEIAQAKAELAAPKFEVGDYAKVISRVHTENTGEGAHEFEIGEIVKLIEADSGYANGFTAESLHGARWFIVAEDLAKATDEEIRWAKIGRKPGEFKKGDIVRLLEYSGAHEAGTLVEVHDNGNYKADDSVWGGEFDRYELVVPVEQRFDLAAEGARQ
jgi:hypothetical protein